MLRAFFSNPITWALTGVVLLAVLLPVGLRNSDAAFVAGTTNDNSLFSSAATFNTVFTSLTDPGTPLRGNVTLNAVASSDRGMGTVAFQTSPAGANTWTTRCNDNAPAYSCNLDTTTLADGLYDIRSLATDSAGYSNSSAVANRRIDNTAPTATTTSAGSPLTGVATVSGTGSDGGSGVASTTLQYRPSGGGSWTDICAQAGASVNCAWNTASLADGLYDVRTIATDLAGNAGASAIVTNRRLDNVAPTATMTAPAANLTGSVTLQSTSADGANGTGIASVRYEYKPTSGSTWSTACTSAASPYSCSFNTSTATDGLYDFRAVAVDGVGKEGASTAVTLRRIDNTAPTATMGALAASLTGAVSLTSTTADSGSGVASVQYQYKLTSGSTWTNACSSSTSPYSCSFNTASVGDGVYDFRAQATDNAGNTGTSTAVFSRRIDNTDPAVTMGALATNLTATASLTSTPSDGGGIASVQYQYKLSSSSTWLNTCSSPTTPYSCSLNTTTLADGVYDFRAMATDNAGRVGYSAAVNARRIDNTNPAVTMTAPAAAIGGTVTLASTPTDAGSGVASVLYEYKLSSSGTWLAACSSSSSPFSCAFSTTALADGLYDFRATATDNVGRTAISAAVNSRRVDNTAPSGATLAAVPTPNTATITLSGTATDSGSGIANWTVQYSPAGANTWTSACNDNATPFSCTFNTALAADALYDFRAVATDAAGNTLASAVQINRRIDNDGPTVSIVNPVAGRIRGTVSLDGVATDPVGVANVTFQYRFGTTGGWTDICSDNTASYTCGSIDTTVVPDGTYQVRMIARDTLNHTTTSPDLTVIIDNTRPNGTDVQAANGGTLGRIDAGDTLTFTWSEPMAPASILAGWGGGAQPIRVRVNQIGGVNDDTLELYDAAGTTRLNVISATQALRLYADYVATGPLWLNATMTMTGNSVVITVGTVISGSNATNETTAGTMQWVTNTAATDVVGNIVNAATITEAGGADREF
jgi:hypothetical protein